ncbi:uncharacterized protein LOC120435660 [Oreochromis aureus]|uniref:uncharacterized protein LOC120435660 n=1 Tax=Oreochromis aureus TaxID=47969 RepID=UPI001954C9B1|nr:uncharacterized protein LOC120435660 [Oreochromis aureus]
MASDGDTAAPPFNGNVDQTDKEDSSQDETEEQTVEALKEQLRKKERENQELRDELSRSTQGQNHVPSQPVQQVQNYILIIIDSTGKFINEKKLFPRDKVVKRVCKDTQQAMEVLSDQQLGSPTHIIIHTGSSEVRADPDRLSKSLKEVISKASTNFPNSTVVISALLPMKNMDTDTIKEINIKLKKECENFNVHLATHPDLDVTCLHDEGYLLKHKVHIFAKKLKDVALNRDTSRFERNAQGSSSSTKNFTFNFNCY